MALPPETQRVKALSYLSDNDKMYVVFRDSDGNLFKLLKEDASTYYYEEVRDLFLSLLPLNTRIDCQCMNETNHKYQPINFA